MAVWYFEPDLFRLKLNLIKRLSFAFPQVLLTAYKFINKPFTAVGLNDARINVSYQSHTDTGLNGTT